MGTGVSSWKRGKNYEGGGACGANFNFNFNGAFRSELASVAAETGAGDGVGAGAGAETGDCDWFIEGFELSLSFSGGGLGATTISPSGEGSLRRGGGAGFGMNFGTNFGTVFVRTFSVREKVNLPCKMGLLARYLRS